MLLKADAYGKLRRSKARAETGGTRAVAVMVVVVVGVFYLKKFVACLRIMRIHS